MDFNKIRSFCRTFRIVLGLALIATGFITGIANFCPLCIISKKCDLPKSESK